MIKYQTEIWQHPTMKHLCGYVLVPKNSIFHEAEYDNLHYLDVHGGITFSGYRETETGEELWALGFDCAHYNDYEDMKPIRTRAFVERELKQLMEQMKVAEVEND